MIKAMIFLVGASACCGRPLEGSSLHVVYSKMLNEVGPSQAEPRSGVAYVYSVTATELPLITEYDSMKPSDLSFLQHIERIRVQKTKSGTNETSGEPKVLLIEDSELVSKLEAREEFSHYSSNYPLETETKEPYK